ncbi:TPA: class C sortase [Streptococcus pyogenes]|uniref:class C sortase n=1 Tax=Streptococcus pyogenes TaxID=1314 RepID=UPI000E087588|nr:class C sortase [Streptococcus pyogenes]SUO44235.1 sortase family protein [Streptococcus pyogenes]VGS30915.1 sortase family protein [Streptococcus pyogenes]VGY24618.1 sortase family protein [Streptococcus pyogenes]VGY58076.1 sortase family protein [Streptococcus pyogenes]VHH43470.1 sortase family protein [Streptococcus pyogenes]
MSKKVKKSSKTRRQKRNNIIFGLIFIMGMLVMAYPLVSRLYYRIEANSQVADFDQERAKLSYKEIDQRMELARAFNDSLRNVVEKDPYSDEMKQKGRVEYARMLEIHERMGHIEIPAMNVDLPMYAGTNEEVLQKGAGHLEGTSLPIGGNSTHSVITAHTGLPTAKLFTDLTKLKVGDKFYIHNIKEILAYQVDRIKVVEPSDFSDLLIVPGHDYVTLLTCTPYMINTHRLLVRGHRVPYVKAVDEKLIAENKISHLYRNLFYASLVLIALLLLIVRRLRKKKKEAEKRLQAMIPEAPRSSQEEG